MTDLRIFTIQLYDRPKRRTMGELFKISGFRLGVQTTAFADSMAKVAQAMDRASANLRLHPIPIHIHVRAVRCSVPGCTWGKNR